MQFTDEQLIFLSDYLNYPLSLIYALAGTGKTTLLLGSALDNPKVKGLYLVFNKANEIEAKPKFPKNFKVATIHGLANKQMRRYLSRLKTYLVNNKALYSEEEYKREMKRIGIFANLRKGEYKEVEIQGIFKVDRKTAKSVLNMFNQYLNSSQMEIKSDSLVAKYVKKLYEKMKYGEIEITHDFYLKEFSLLLRKGIVELAYDILLMDEAQDTNMVTLSVCNCIKVKSRVFVGDDNQQIYSFRGSINAFDKLRNPKVFYLTETFRFPKYNADWANKVLKLKGSKIFLKSNVEIDERYNLYKKDADYCLKIEDEHHERCYISRSNSALIERMISFIQEGRKFKTIRHPNELFSLLEEVNFLDMNQREKIWKHTFLLSKNEQGRYKYNNINDLEVYAQEVDDIELLSAISIVKKFGAILSSLKQTALEHYDNYAVNSIDYKDFLTTAHTCKGFEWDYVAVMDTFKDFISLIVKADCNTISEFRKNIKKIDSNIVDEFNLFYVAMTRSKMSMEVLDSNEFYLNLEDWEIDKLIFEYKRLLEEFTDGISESFEFNPKVILGYEKEGFVEESSDITSAEVVELFKDKNDYKQSFSEYMDEQARIIAQKDVIRKQRSNLTSMKNLLGLMAEKNIEKKEQFMHYSKSLKFWEEPKIKDGFLYVNGLNVGSEANVGARVGRGTRIHPMTIKIIGNNIEIKNNTKWKYSELTVIDLLDNIPNEVISSIGSLKE